MIPIYPLTVALCLAATVKSQDIASAGQFGVLGASTVTSTGLTVIKGLLGVFPGTSITGFPPGIAGTQHSADAVAQTAQKDAHAAFTAAAALTTTQDLTGADLGGLTLGAGVYAFSSSVGLTGVLTLDGGGNADSRFIFKIGSTLITGTGASVVLINGAKACNVIWQVGSSATLGTSTSFVGYVIAQASVTANSAVTVNGGLYALTAAVTMIDDTIDAQDACGGTTTPTTSSSSSEQPTILATTSVAPIATNVQPTTTSQSSDPPTSLTTTTWGQSSDPPTSWTTTTTSTAPADTSVWPTTTSKTTFKTSVQPTTTSKTTCKTSVHPTTTSKHCEPCKSTLAV